MVGASPLGGLTLRRGENAVPEFACLAPFRKMIWLIPGTELMRIARWRSGEPPALREKRLQITEVKGQMSADSSRSPDEALPLRSVNWALSFRLTRMCRVMADRAERGSWRRSASKIVS